MELYKYLESTYPGLIDIKDNEGNNLVHSAVWVGNMEMLKVLLEKGLDINDISEKEKIVPLLSCINDKTDISKHLLDMYPYSIDTRDNCGENTIHVAAWCGNIDFLNFLVRHGFDINSTRNDGKTVLHLCCRNSKIDMCKFLVKAYPHLLHVDDHNGVNALHEAAWSGNIDLFKFLLDKGLDVNIKERKDGNTVLHLCCFHGKIDMCGI
ncbi:putative ankyrin repeat protein RF_0381 [Saccostrea cucullata]|uniref:putative ankyrin repeat protein RF_0381 n=1 Tax=Saccostrea cuccullata TaxID=36930 RepID=UPI002ED5154C